MVDAVLVNGCRGVSLEREATNVSCEENLHCVGIYSCLRSLSVKTFALKFCLKLDKMPSEISDFAKLLMQSASIVLFADVCVYHLI